MAGSGIIIRPSDILVPAYVSQIDYSYPSPSEGSFAVYPYLGNSRISNRGQHETIQIGVKADRTDFGDLPPLNLAFVIDKSGSMKSDGKLDWVKESFDIFIEKVRDVDYVSLIVFDSESEVIFPSTRMMSGRDRERFKDAVSDISAGGGTNLVAGLEDGYSQVLANFRSEYNNRVLFLTDGVGESGGILEMADAYRENGINVSTIGVGSNFDVNLMIALAIAGGGSSRFISDREQMLKTFGDELDRMIVPAARDVTIHVDFPEYVTLEKTWGYDYEISGNRVSFRIPTLHNGDYETILADVLIAGNENAGECEIARISYEYKDLKGESFFGETAPLSAEFIRGNSHVYGISDYRVLQSSTMKFIAQRFQEIGSLYYDSQETVNRMNEERSETLDRRDDLDQLSDDERQSAFDSITSESIRGYESSLAEKLSRALELTIDTKIQVANSRAKLDNSGFEDELMILDRYIEILGKEQEYSEEEIRNSQNRREILPDRKDISLNSYVQAMLDELILSMGPDGNSTLAITPFSQGNGARSLFTEYLDRFAQKAFYEMGFTLVEREKLDEIISEQKLTLTGLVDTDTAISIGNLLSSRYLVTGNVIPMANSVVVFSRVLEVSSGEILAVSQVIIPRSEDLAEMVGKGD
ncbi:MAG: VWA domain-containing protein [Spirochaetales bacterium]|nr:VWA domain-containing protein [Spirochaetales bacterium]